MSTANSVVYLNGQVDQGPAPAVRQEISVRLRKIGQAFYSGNVELAKRYCRDLYEFRGLNDKYLESGWPAVR